MRKPLTAKLAWALVAIVIAALAAPALAPEDQVAAGQSRYVDHLKLDGRAKGDGPSGGPSRGKLRRKLGPLPLTGVDVAILAAVAVTMGGIGVAVQRLTAPAEAGRGTAVSKRRIRVTGRRPRRPIRQGESP